MILYSIIPEETVMAGYQEYTPDYLDMVIDGVQMQVERINHHQARIVRIFSSELHHYLNPDYAPGNVVDFPLSIRQAGSSSETCPSM